MKRDYSALVWDYFLCSWIGTELAVNVFAGFEMTDPWSGNLLVVIGIVMSVLAVLFLAHTNRKTRLACAGLTVAALLALCARLWQASAAGGGAIDANPLLFWVIVLAVSSAVFWLTRSRAGMVLLYLGGTLTMAAFRLLVYPVSVWAYIAFVLGTAVLFLYRIICTANRHEELQSPGVFSHFVQCVLLSLAACVLSSGIYFGIIKPLSPPADSLNLVSKLMTMPVLKELGIATTTVSAEHTNTIQQKDQTNQSNRNRLTAQDQKGHVVHSQHLFSSLKVSFKKHAGMLGLSLAVLLLLLPAAVVVKLFLRKKWYVRVLKKEKEDGAMELYLYCAEKIRKAGVLRPQMMTLLEFAGRSQAELQGFAVYDATFLHLTQIYQRILYGYQTISEEEYEQFQDFYRAFHKNLQSKLGRIRYCMCFFML